MNPTVTSPAGVYVFSQDMKNRYRAVGWMFIGIGMAAACFLAWMVFTNTRAGAEAKLMLVLVLGISAVPIVEGAIFLRGASRVSVSLSGDTIQIRGLLGSRRMRLADIAGKSRVPGRGSVVTYLMPRPNCSESRLRLPDDLTFDDAFDSWFASLPDLNEISEEMRQAATKLHWWEQRR